MALLYDEINTSALFCSLYGAKRTFEKQLKLTDVYYILHNNHKAALTLNTKRDPSKPYGFFSMGSLAISKEYGNNKSIRRSGYTHSQNNFAFVNSATNATIHNFFMFPAEISCEFHYYNNDIKELTRFLEVFAILAVTDCFNFMVKINEEAEWVVRVEITDNMISIPEIDLESAENPATSEIVVPFVIHTKIGFVRDVAKVNSDRPLLTFALNTADQTSESIP